MLIHPWDAALNDHEWRDWLATVENFGVLAVGNLDPSQAPLLLPLHFTAMNDELWFHLARPNPVWPHLEASTEVRLAVSGDHAYIPSYWRADPTTSKRDGVPTSYYASVQFVCSPTIIDDPHDKVEVLSAQLADLQPEGRHGDLAVDRGPYGRMLAGIRAARLAIAHVEAKFKYDDQKPPEHRSRVADELDARATGLDARAALQQRRRMEALGEWSRQPTNQ